MKLSLQKAVAVVTGGGSGVGREICLKVAEEGAAVAVLDIHESNARSVAQAITDKGGKAVAFVCDVGSVDSIQAAVAQIVSSLGSPGLLFNNAGTVKYER